MLKKNRIEKKVPHNKTSSNNSSFLAKSAKKRPTITTRVWYLQRTAGALIPTSYSSLYALCFYLHSNSNFLLLVNRTKRKNFFGNNQNQLEQFFNFDSFTNRGLYCREVYNTMKLFLHYKSAIYNREQFQIKSGL